MSGSNAHNPPRGDGAYQYEMLDRELDPTLREFAGDLRAALVTAPAPERAEAQIAAMLAEARATASSEAPTRPMRPRRVPVLRLAAIGAASLVVLTGGLAVAGIRPPEPVSDLLEGLGVDVPGSDGDETAPAAGPSNQPAGQGDRSGASNAPSPGNANAEQGSTGAGQGSGNGGGRGHGQGNDNEGRPGQGNGNGAEASAEGQQTAEEAQSGQTPPSEPGNSENAQSQGGGSGQPTPPDHSQGSPPSEPQADAPGQTQEGGNPHGTAPGAGVSSQAQETGAAHANENAAVGGPPE